MAANRWAAARRHLSRRDPTLGGLITQVGPCTLEPGGEPFAVLVESVIAQLISTPAARTVTARLLALVGDTGVTPASITALSVEQLRGVGLSGTKVASLRELADRATDGRLALSALGTLSDEQIATALTDVRGIGPWTVMMFLIFGLGRADVLPTGDFGLRAGVRDLYRLEELPKPKDLTALAEPWRPWRSIATWYVWRGRGFVPRSGTV